LVSLKRLPLLIILNVIAVISYLVVSSVSGSIEHVVTSVFSSPDSLSYRAVADWIFGARANPEASAWRPFLYPLLLGTAERLGGIRGVWLLNVGFWFIALNFAAAATDRFVKSSWAAALVFVLLATNISLILLTFEGLTEIITVTLLAVWTYGLSRLTRSPTASQVAWALLPMALLVVVKPEFELLLAVMVVVLAVAIVRSSAPGLRAAALAACLTPVAIQLAVNAHFNGFFGVSNIGETAIRSYYLPRLEVAIGQSSNFGDARLKTFDLSASDAARLVLNHFGEAVQVFRSTLFENLVTGSSFVTHGHPRIAGLTVSANVIYFVVLLVSIPIGGVALWRARDGRLALLCLALLTIYFAGGLTFRQGDRITIVALPLLVVAFVLAVKEAGGVLIWESLAARLRPRSKPTIPATHGPESAPES
jgi:hypothetical protein